MFIVAALPARDSIQAWVFISVLFGKVFGDTQNRDTAD